MTGPVILMLIADRVKRPVSVHSLLPSSSPHLLEATLRGMGIELRGQAGATLDLEAFKRRLESTLPPASGSAAS